ncbi:MAG TPA: pyridoxal-dependent decarboxylase [Candidatus Nanopelagicales bacterium]
MARDRDMHTHDERLTRMVLTAMHDRLAMDPVPLDRPGDVAALTAQLDGLINAEGTDPHRVMEVWSDVLAPHVMSSDAANFLAFIPAAPTKAALLFDMLVSGASIQGISALEAAGAIAAENQVLGLLADLAGLPPSAGGVFVSGGSAGNLSALTVARDLGRRRRDLGRGSLTRIAVSDQAHSSITNALSILDMTGLVVPTHDHRLTGPALAAALAADDDPSSVVGVVATAGTTNAGIIDDLVTVGEVARAHDLWLHVDGAYGGGGLLAPSLRPLYAGIEQADSFVVDPHKWLFAPYDCAALLYREPRLAKAVHTQDASYLDVIHAVGDEWNPSDLAYHLTRRARGLPLWFSLAVNGTDAYAEAVGRAVDLARWTARYIDGQPHLHLLREPTLSVVLFERLGWQPADYDRWAAALLDEQTALVTSTRWEGRTVGRLVFLHPRTTTDLVEEVLARMA